MHRKLLGIMSVDFDTRSAAYYIFCIRQIIERKYEYNEKIHKLFINFKKTHYSFRREVLCNIYIDFSTVVKLVSLIQICLNGICRSPGRQKFHIFIYTVNLYQVIYIKNVPTIRTSY